MGVILDSSVLIAGERRGESVRQILKRVQAAQGEADSALSVVTIVELTHGISEPRATQTASGGELLAKNSAVTWWCIL